MEIWLKQNQSKLRLPVLPSGYSVTSAQNNTILNVNSLGEILLLGKRGLQSVSLSSFSQTDMTAAIVNIEILIRPKSM